MPLAAGAALHKPPSQLRSAAQALGRRSMLCRMHPHSLHDPRSLYQTGTWGVASRNVESLCCKIMTPPREPSSCFKNSSTVWFCTVWQVVLLFLFLPQRCSLEGAEHRTDLHDFMWGIFEVVLMINLLGSISTCAFSVVFVRSTPTDVTSVLVWHPTHVTFVSVTSVSSK